MYVADVMGEVADCEEVPRDWLKRDSPAAKSRSPVLGHPEGDGVRQVAREDALALLEPEPLTHQA